MKSVQKKAKVTSTSWTFWDGECAGSQSGLACRPPLELYQLKLGGMQAPKAMPCCSCRRGPACRPLHSMLQLHMLALLVCGVLPHWPLPKPEGFSAYLSADLKNT